MGKEFPDAKTVVDSIADGVVELAEGPVRVVQNMADVAETFASEVKSNMDDVKAKMPDDPSAIPGVVIRGAGQTVNAAVSVFEGIGKGIMDTVEGVKNQIKRVTG